MFKLKMIVLLLVLVVQPQDVRAVAQKINSVFVACASIQVSDSEKVCVKFQLRKPLLYLAGAGENSVTLGWSEVQYAEEYIILRKEPEGYRMIGRVPSKVRFFVDRNVECGNRYTNAIFARNYGKSSKMSNLVIATTAYCQ